MSAPTSFSRVTKKTSSRRRSSRRGSSVFRPARWRSGRGSPPGGRSVAAGTGRPLRFPLVDVDAAVGVLGQERVAALEEDPLAVVGDVGDQRVEVGGLPAKRSAAARRQGSRGELRWRSQETQLSCDPPAAAGS